VRFLKKHSSVIVATALLVAILYCVFPFYQYYIDPDATAYLTLAKRYAEGDFLKAVNGYWSPWAVWLTALLMKAGMAPFSAAIVVNGAAAIGFLFVSHSLFVFFDIKKGVRWLYELALVVFLVYAVFWQSFDDLWECFFLLVLFRTLIRNDFEARPLLWILTGVLGALAYLAKAYALPFVLLEIVCCSFLLIREKGSGNGKKWIRIAAVCMCVTLLLSSPWFYLLYEKYGKWMTGTAGSLNTSWYLVGHPYWKESIGQLLPPVYTDSPSYWEDAYMVNGVTPHFWNSPKLLLLQIIKAGYNLLKLVQSINELSAFFAVALLFSIGIFFSEKVRATYDRKTKLLALSFLLFPSGYLLVNFQARYLWYMLPLSMILLAIFIPQISFFTNLKDAFKRLLFPIIAFSFIVMPLLGLREMYRAGEEEYIQAIQLRQLNIRGAFTTNIPYSSRSQNIVRLAYFSGNPYYNMPVSTTRELLLNEIRRYQIPYYFHFYEGEWDDFVLKDEYGSAFREVTGGKIKGLKVFAVGQ
jgi:hypothetical protein